MTTAADGRSAKSENFAQRRKHTKPPSHSTPGGDHFVIAGSESGGSEEPSPQNLKILLSVASTPSIAASLGMTISNLMGGRQHCTYFAVLRHLKYHYLAA
jgi:hypothetical protein